MKCFDAYKKGWKGSPLELVLTLLLKYYERQAATDTHSFIDKSLKEVGVGSLD